MKKSTIVFLFFLLPFLSEAKNLWAYLTYTTFNSPEGPYVETYLSIAGNSVKFLKTEDGKYQAFVNILITFKDKDVVKAYKKYELKSPLIPDTSKMDFNFLDVQRFQLPNGSYDFEIQISDKNKDVKPAPYTQQVLVDFQESKPVFSGIQLVSSYTKSSAPTMISKSGYDLVPHVFTFYPETQKNIAFYCEFYNADKVMGDGQKYVINYFVESFENGLKFNEFGGMKKFTPHSVDVLLSEINIENLATGNYNLVVEARNQKNELVASKKVFFQRSNPNAKLTYTDLISLNSSNTFVDKIKKLDTIKEFISCTYPISSGIERAFIRDAMKSLDIVKLKQYFYGFWLRRDEKSPEKAWLAYKAEVDKVNYNFRTPVKKGYQTDRGMVYLEYGAPNTRSEHPMEPNTYPYEIWQYYTMKNNQRNKKFVFYSPDRVTSDFLLLHSDATGEYNNPQWQTMLHSRNTATVGLQETQDSQYFNSSGDDASWGDDSKKTWQLPN